MQGDAHGYLIIKVMNDIIGPFTRLSHGRLYPLLAKLETDGLIATTMNISPRPRKHRHLRTFHITDIGRQRFHELMMDTISNPGEYQRLFLYKIQGMDYMSADERLFLIDHYSTFCQTHIHYLTAKAEDMQRRAEQGTITMTATRISSTLNVMQHVVDQWSLELQWVEQLREQEML
jgi:DNA-binding PadR family transcriptional regulator